MTNEIHADHASGSTLYAVIRSEAGQVWCPAQEVFESWGAGGHTADDYDIALADHDGSRYVGDFDASVPAGRYFIQVFLQAGTNPADSDTVVSSRHILWTGSGELTAAKCLANKAVQNRATGAITYYDDDGLTALFTHVILDTPAAVSRSPN